jgi:hypothetical protein
MCEETVCDPYMTPTIVSLSAAADYFEFPTLRKYAVEYACKQIMEFKLLALPFLTAVDLIVGSDPRIRECAINCIQTDYTGSIVGLESKHITALSHSVLESIVSDNAIFVDEIHLFLLVKQWSQGPTMEESEADEQQDDRKSFASALIAKHIRCDRITYFGLSETVVNSGLLTTEQLFEAYKSHAELASNNNSQALVTKRMPYWADSNLPVAVYRANAPTRLRCRAMASGRHVWSIEIVTRQPRPSLCCDMYLGVCNPAGDKQHWKRFDAASVSAGSIVTFTLDLTEAEAGSLSYSVDGRPTVVISANILNLSFVPAVHIQSAGLSVRFKGFDPSSYF